MHYNTCMNYYDVLVSTRQKVSTTFTYASKETLNTLQVVDVSFRNQELKGLILGLAPRYKGAKKIEGCEQVHSTQATGRSFS